MVGFNGLTRPFERQRLCPDDLVKTENRMVVLDYVRNKGEEEREGRDHGGH
jgi:hypothetical protein